MFVVAFVEHLYYVPNNHASLNIIEIQISNSRKYFSYKEHETLFPNVEFLRNVLNITSKIYSLDGK